MAVEKIVIRYDSKGEVMAFAWPVGSKEEGLERIQSMINASRRNPNYPEFYLSDFDFGIIDQSDFPSWEEPRRPASLMFKEELAGVK